MTEPTSEPGPVPDRSVMPMPDPPPAPIPEPAASRTASVPPTQLPRKGLPIDARFLAWLARTIARCVLRIRVEGLEHLPATGAFILAPNHISNIDPPLVHGWAAPRVGQRLRFLAKEVLFKGFAGRLLRWQGVVPVKMGGSDMEAYRVAKAMLAAGDVIVIFPEGTRSKDGRLGRPRPGVSMLASREQVPVVPVGISGSDAFLQKGSKVPRVGARVIVRFGPAYLPTTPKGDRRAALAAADEELVRRIAALLEPRHRGDVEPWPDA